jgi:hypothetical protein
MAITVKYAITNSQEYINIDGIAGTSAAGVSYNLNKANINKIVDDTVSTVGIVMLNNDDYSFDYRELRDIGTGLAYASLAAAVTALDTMANTTSLTSIETATAYTGLLISEKITLTAAAEEIAPGYGAGWLTIKSHKDNTAAITIGGIGITTGAGFELDPAEALSLEHTPLSSIYVIGAENDVVYIFGSAKTYVAPPTTTAGPTTTVIVTTTSAPTTTATVTTTLLATTP